MLVKKSQVGKQRFLQ